jgi:hypothetical protein
MIVKSGEVWTKPDVGRLGVGRDFEVRKVKEWMML